MPTINLPWWAKILVKMAIRFGIPELKKHVSPEVAKFIENILLLISGVVLADRVDIKQKSVAQLQAHFKSSKTA